MFLITGGVSEDIIKISKRENVITLSKDFTSLFTLINSMYKCEKIFLHGLFNFKIVFLLFLQPWLLKKSNWIVWGGDLYHYKFRKRNFKSDVQELVRRFVIKNFGAITTLVKGDYDLAKKWYGVKGDYYHGVYINPVNLEYLQKVKKIKKDNRNGINIQIGNSADPSNNHIQILDLLKKFKDENINIYAPLSYGNHDYAKEVVHYGKELFGNKFKPLLEFLNPEEYSKYLASIDIAIFNHERQQALGNIYALLYLGKKIYIRSDISTWDYLKEQLNLNLFDIKEINNQNFVEFTNCNNLEDNTEKIEKIFAADYIRSVWKKIF
ncbi:TDP-N-acetylfucosamine:lipid II N-acetylfucosaminyltransferase [Geobacillus subterraneus]|uniref:TDP-N-acetylfucosamine:lipid II N-acetylfucosaminyltransferase n=1 Tax=Geobacillus subterraneus TaxID=129338 RepID=UPI001442D99E|nr:TDP-N-acetylfucosamine:lipid II N-acetylfucosaminyltransferase [Geobacillus subterraneus]QIZ66040.1 TDP-N-acetylfucosamine:lipid II N-acetylfucosaminyltransferase [Geobacillus subterraneus]